MNTMGFEKICKAYLLAKDSAKYENLKNDMEVKKKVNFLAKKWGHKLEKMVDEIKGSIDVQLVGNVMNQDYDDYTGNDFIKVMQAAYLECRYPVPAHICEEFPIEGKTDMCWDPIASSGVEKFCFAFTRMIITKLKENFDIPIPKEKFDEIITGDTGERFCNLFLKDTADDFLRKQVAVAAVPYRK